MKNWNNYCHFDFLNNFTDLCNSFTKRALVNQAWLVYWLDTSFNDYWLHASFLNQSKLYRLPKSNNWNFTEIHYDVWDKPMIWSNVLYLP